MGSEHVQNNESAVGRGGGHLLIHFTTYVCPIIDAHKVIAISVGNYYNANTSVTATGGSH